MSEISGVILAGGEGSRMHSRHKPLMRLGGRPLLSHVISRARPQVERLALSVNDPDPEYAATGLPLIHDLPALRRGPLVGICSAMQWYLDQGQDTGYLACFPADVPAFPKDLVARLLEALRSQAPEEALPATVAWCRTGAQIQPLFSLWPMAVLPQMLEAIQEGIHGPRLYFRRYPNLMVQLPPPAPPMFFNINTPEQLAEAERRWSWAE